MTLVYTTVRSMCKIRNILYRVESTFKAYISSPAKTILINGRISDWTKNMSAVEINNRMGMAKVYFIFKLKLKVSSGTKHSGAVSSILKLMKDKAFNMVWNSGGLFGIKN